MANKMWMSLPFTLNYVTALAFTKTFLFGTEPFREKAHIVFAAILSLHIRTQRRAVFLLFHTVLHYLSASVGRFAALDALPYCVTGICDTSAKSDTTLVVL